MDPGLLQLEADLGTVYWHWYNRHVEYKSYSVMVGVHLDF